MKRIPQFFSRRLTRQAACVACLLLVATPLAAQTGTFIDRDLSSDLRVVSYNIFLDSIFLDDPDGPAQAPKFARVMQALQPDIINLQEIYNHSAAQTASLMNSILPLGGGATWYGHKSFDNIIVSKYPLSMTATDTNPEPSSTSVAIALVDLPDAQFDTDFYFMNNHFKCCGGVGSSEDQQRQRQADALVNWMRDARTAGGFVNLPADTPMAVVGDLNLVGSLQPLDTLITGNIINEGTYGADSPPDWDGSALADLHPLHNGVGPADFTWHDAGGPYPDGRLDYVLYTDNILEVANNFVLNTVDMTPAERAATGMQIYDVTIDAFDWDHLPLVVDFRFASSDTLGDYDDSGYVDEADFNFWRSQYGMSVAEGTESDGNGDGVINGADYSIWRDNLGAGTPPSGGGSAAAVPEPGTLTLCIVCGAVLLFRRRAD